MRDQIRNFLVLQGGLNVLAADRAAVDIMALAAPTVAAVQTVLEGHGMSSAAASAAAVGLLAHLAPAAPPAAPPAPTAPAPTVNPDGTWNIPMPAARVTPPPQQVYHIMPAGGAQATGQPPAPPQPPQSPRPARIGAGANVAIAAVIALLALLALLGFMVLSRRTNAEDNGWATLGLIERMLDNVGKASEKAFADAAKARDEDRQLLANTYGEAEFSGRVLREATGAQVGPDGSVRVDRMATKADVDRARRAVWAAAAKVGREADARHGARQTPLTAEEARRLLAPLSKDAAATRRSVWQAREEARSAFDRLGRRKVSVRVVAAE